MARLETPRLLLRPFTLEDAPFTLGLLNQPSFLEHIGDKGVRDQDQARAYLLGGPMKSWTERGHGLSLVALRSTGEPLGMCGLLWRKEGQDLDLGYAFLPEHEGRGYAREAARAALEDGRGRLGLSRILALVSPGNAKSIRLLGDLGFRIVQGASETDTLMFEQWPEILHAQPTPNLP